MVHNVCFFFNLWITDQYLKIRFYVKKQIFFFIFWKFKSSINTGSMYFPRTWPPGPLRGACAFLFTISTWSNSFIRIIHRPLNAESVIPAPVQTACYYVRLWSQTHCLALITHTFCTLYRFMSWSPSAVILRSFMPTFLFGSTIENRSHILIMSTNIIGIE